VCLRWGQATTGPFYASTTLPRFDHADGLHIHSPIHQYGIVTSISIQDSADTLRIYGNLSLLEMAPVLLAAVQTYPGKTGLEHGSVMALWGKAGDLASLTSVGQADLATNSETQALRGSVANPVAFHIHRCGVSVPHRRAPLGRHQPTLPHEF